MRGFNSDLQSRSRAESALTTCGALEGAKAQGATVVAFLKYCADPCNKKGFNYSMEIPEMRKAIKLLAAAALVGAFAVPMSSSAQWYGPGYGYGPYYGPGSWGPGYGRGLGDMFGFGDMFSDFDFTARGSGRGWGHGRGYGDGYGYGHPYGYGYRPYYGRPWGGPWGAPPAAPQAEGN